jgi:hypothetical protein
LIIPWPSRLKSRMALVCIGMSRFFLLISS